MNIVDLAYELYKIDWMRRISADRQIDALKDYYETLTFADEEETEYSFDDYLEVGGYDGELYACFDEFLDCEFLDKTYMKKLLNNNSLIAEYEKYLKENH